MAPQCHERHRLESSLNRPLLPRNDANRRESTTKPAYWHSFATARDAPSGFRFRYRKVWGFKSLLVHYSETIRKVGPQSGYESTAAVRRGTSAICSWRDSTLLTVRARVRAVS